MNDLEKENYQKLLNDLSSDNLSDQDIVEMWKAPALEQLNSGLSNYKLEQFLISKGISKTYAPKALKWLKEQNGGKSGQQNNQVSFGSIITDMLETLLSKFTKGR